MTYIPPQTQAKTAVVPIGTDSATIDITGLDLNTDGGYRIDYDLIISNVGAYPNIFGYLNNDTTATNYTTVRAQLANGGQGFYTSNDPFIMACDANTACKVSVYIRRDALGKIWIWREGIGAAGGSILFGDRGYISYTQVTNNITSFKLVGDQALCFLSLSSYRVFKLQDPTTVAYDTYSSALLHFDGSDESTTITEGGVFPKTWTAAGDAALDTAQKVFGTASLYLQGAGSISTPDNPVFAVGTGDFTWDARIRVPAIPTGGNSFAIMQKGNLSWGLSATNMDVTIGAGPTVISRTWSPTVDTWYAIRVARKDGVIKMFANGTGIGATEANTENGTTASVLYIGDVSGGGAPYTGWIDEFRFINSCDSLDDYTPAAEAFTN